METLDGSVSDDIRERALERLKKKHEFVTHCVVFTLFNAFAIGIWVMTGHHGFFWPIFLLFGWGIGLVMHAWDLFARTPTEDRIRREMDRLGRRY